MDAIHPSVLEQLLLIYARRFPIRRGKLRVIDSLWETAMGDRGTHRVAHLKYGGFQMPCDVREMLQRQFYFFGTYFMSERVIESWQRHAGGARVIFDVGANAGIFSLAALAVQPHAIVHAFEPTPEIANGLRNMVALNGLPQLHVHELAVWSNDGHATLRRFRGELGTNEGMNFVTTLTGEPDAELVETVCLDRFCRDHALDRIDLLKVDIQGNEHQALEGAADLLRTGRIGTVFTELNWAAAGDICPATESIRLLEQSGYRFSKPAPRLEWRRSGTWMRELSDVVARRVPPGESVAAD